MDSTIRTLDEREFQMKHIYEAVVTAKGGRDGYIKSSDGILDMKVSVPKEMGGQGGATNPEQLFAAGYAACFENALIYVARAKKLPLENSSVTAHVAIGKNESGGFQLAVRMDILLPGLDPATAQSLIEEGHKICPYSNATRGNIAVELNLLS
jgi:osmotically inducible protein OsmC